jgi:RES domain-containing protein
MRVWRICKAAHAATAFSGEGARLYGGRWHRRGTRVVYTSESRALAALEQLVHLGRSPLPPGFVCFAVDIPDALRVPRIEPHELPAHWYRNPAPPELADLGTRWVASGRSAALQVPSAVVRGEHNVLLNPAHADFARLRIGRPQPFELDPRLLPAR